MTTAKTIGRVLVLDDDPLFREIASALLKAQGVTEVATASTVVEARSLFVEFMPDLLMLDLNLPDADGVEFIEYLQGVGSTVPILVVSGADTTVRRGAAVLASAYRLLVVGVIKKPLTKGKLKGLRLPFPQLAGAA